jgi:hypothetical protein
VFAPYTQNLAADCALLPHGNSTWLYFNFYLNLLPRVLTPGKLNINYKKLLNLLII